MQTCGTQVIACNVDQSIIQAVMGHSGYFCILQINVVWRPQESRLFQIPPMPGKRVQEERPAERKRRRLNPVPSSIESNNAEDGGDRGVGDSGRDQGAGGDVEDGERAAIVRMGGAGADGELVLQVATVASATEDVTKALEATSKTVSVLLSYEWEVLVLTDVTKALEATSKTVSVLLSYEWEVLVLTLVLNVAVADVDLVLVIVAVVSVVVVYVVAVSGDEVLVVVELVSVDVVDVVDVVSVELVSVDVVSVDVDLLDVVPVDVVPVDVVPVDVVVDIMQLSKRVA
eukprot:jgi/Phyca11/14830/fgenesh1_pg.PHYCAscaffold_9_\